jgi:hypothetical protein
MNRGKLFFGIWLVSLSVLMLELGLTRLFSATMYYHFAFLAISLALFGSGASGVFIYVLQGRIKLERTANWLGIASMLSSATTVLALEVILRNQVPLDIGPETFRRLTSIYCAAALPFFFAGCAVTLAITRLAGDISRLYLFDLIGAAFGCVLLIPALNWLGAVNAILLVAALMAAASFVFNLEAKSRAAMALSLLLALALAALIGYNRASRGPDLRWAKGRSQAGVLFSKWNSFSRVTVEGDLSAPSLEIKIDSDAATTILKGGDDLSGQKSHMDKISALAYHLRPGSSALIIGPGGGGDVLTARLFGMRKITAVEVNPIIANEIMSSEPFKSYSGAIYEHPAVELVVDEGRSFIRSSREKYDIIQATMVDTWAATAAGAFALTENNLYTVEAFKDYIEHLTDDGLLTMTRWYLEPPDQLLRLISIARATMSELGIGNHGRHIILIVESKDKERVPATLIFKKSEFSDEEVRTLESLAARNNFELLYTPLTRPDNIFTRLIEAQDPAQIWRSFQTNIEPTRDNNPFFFNSLRPSHLGLALTRHYEWQKTNLGTLMLFALLGITSAMVVAFILGPLALTGRRALATRTASKLSALIYFACLGTGFMIVEIAMIQKFILFLGHPVYSLAVVLFSLLLFSGLGSYCSGRLKQPKLDSALKKILIALAALVGIYIIALPPVFYGLVHLERAVRILIAVALIGPLATLMGMPMPLAIRILNQKMPEMVPWAWGVNGAASVMGSVAALVVAILTGFNQALILGASIYLLSIAFITRLARQEAKTERQLQEELQLSA